MNLTSETFSSLENRSADELLKIVHSLKDEVSYLNDFVENGSLPLHRVDGNGIILWANEVISSLD
ncbi:MAG: hypothetical protein EOP07_23955 [Proteobacteria bacterium]|nr:MAG: hypothetical protein EOP07_23955 [Pseudomonadota bacterium]